MSFLKGNIGSILGTISPGLGALTGKGLGADLLPILSPLAGLLMGGKGGSGGGGESPSAQPAAPAAPQPNGAARGLGRLIGADPARISSIATSIGKGANAVASAGGAQEGYSAPEMPAINNQMQLLDPRIIQQLMRYFNGGGTGQMR